MRPASYLGLVTTLAIAATAGQIGRPIPPVKANLLTGTPVVLPQDLRGEPTVLIIGFSQGSRVQVADWGRRLTQEYGTTHKAKWFEIAEFESVPRVLRGWVTKKVKESVSPRGQQTFLIITDHEREWKQIAGFSAADEAYVVVVDGTGIVRGVTHGAVADSTFAQVRSAVDAARPK